MNRLSAAAIIACIATGAAGFVFGAVVGAAGFGVLSSAARDSERTKLVETEAKLKQVQAVLDKAADDSSFRLMVLREIREKHPEIIKEIRKESALPDRAFDFDF